MKFIFIYFLFSCSVFSQSKLEKAVDLFGKNDFTHAKPLFEQVLAKEPANLKALECLGDMAGQNKEWPTALTYYKKLRSLKPSVADYQYKYGGALGMIAKDANKFTALSMVDEVRDAFLKAIQLDPKHIPARWALVEFYLQLPGIVGGSEKKATRYAIELSQLSPVDGFLAKARIAEYFNRYSQAESHYRAAVAVGKSKTCYQKLADLYKNKMKRPDKAKAVMDEFYNLSKN